VCITASLIYAMDLFSITLLHLKFLNTLHEFHGNNTHNFVSPDSTASEA